MVVMTAPKKPLSQAKQDALAKANAARLRGRHDRMAAELRDAGWTVEAPRIEHRPVRYRVELHFADTGWEPRAETFAPSELDTLRRSLEGWQLVNGQELHEGANFRFAPTTDYDEETS